MNNQYIEYVIWGVKPDDKNKPEYLQESILQQYYDDKFITSKLMETIEDKNFNAISFYLRNRAPEDWSDRQVVDHQLDLTDVLTDARARIIDHAPAHALKNSARTPRVSDSEGADE